MDEAGQGDATTSYSNGTDMRFLHYESIRPRSSHYEQESPSPSFNGNFLSRQSRQTRVQRVIQIFFTKLQLS